MIFCHDLSSDQSSSSVLQASRARDEEGAGRERHDQDAGGRGVDVHVVPASESNPPHHTGGAARQQ